VQTTIDFTDREGETLEAQQPVKPVKPRITSSGIKITLLFGNRSDSSPSAASFVDTTTQHGVSADLHDEITQAVRRVDTVNAGDVSCGDSWRLSTSVL
jgi:hypothetical protein